MSANVRAAISQSLRTPRANRPWPDASGPTASSAPAPAIAMSYPSSEQTALKPGAYIPSSANWPDLAGDLRVGDVGLCPRRARSGGFSGEGGIRTPDGLI